MNGITYLTTCYRYLYVYILFIAERRERSERSEANNRVLFVYIYITRHTHSA